jgi:hypothetical protein
VLRSLFWWEAVLSYCEASYIHASVLLWRWVNTQFIPAFIKAEHVSQLQQMMLHAVCSCCPGSVGEERHLSWGRGAAFLELPQPGLPWNCTPAAGPTGPVPVAAASKLQMCESINKWLACSRDCWVQRSDAAEAVVSFAWYTLPYRTWRDHIAGRQCMDTTQVWHGRLIQGVDMCTLLLITLAHHHGVKRYICKELPYMRCSGPRLNTQHSCTSVDGTLGFHKPTRQTVAQMQGCWY